MTKRFKIPVFLLLFLTGIVNAQISKPVKIPFVYENNTIIIPVKIKDQKLNFIYDTGMNYTLIMDTVAVNLLKLPKTRRIFLVGLGGKNKIPAFLTHNMDFSLKNIIFRHQPLIFTENEIISYDNYYKTPIHGIIGGSVFQNHIVQIDYAKKVLKIYPPEKPPRKIKGKPIETYTHGNKFIIQIKTGDDRPGKFLLDTGNNDAFWFYHLPDSSAYPYRLVYNLLGHGISGEIFGFNTLTDNIELAGILFNRVFTAIPDSASMQFVRHDTSYRGLIGNDFLSKFLVTLDYKNKQVYLKKRFWSSKTFRYDKSGIVVSFSKPVIIFVDQYKTVVQSGDAGERSQTEVKRIREKKIVFTRVIQIDDIIPGSPAEKAGLKKGDLIFEINGKPVYQLEFLSDFTAYLSQKEGKTIRLQIKRNGVSMNIKFKLKDYFKK